MLPSGQSLVLEEVLVLIGDELLRTNVVNQLIDESASVYATHDVGKAVDELLIGHYSFLICDAEHMASSALHVAEATGTYPIVLVNVHEIGADTIYGKGPEIIFYSPYSPTPLDNLSPLTSHVRERFVV